ncbi:PEP-utilizing enzyme [Catellatospora vulcania]|uniref:PEP-utilizing enzyme n=1 Tax=Catellatospora vulcania TaxID=1460450 RepID=UPI0012D4698C|nr:PEP-utilizing enzyme [Catellatospora vulcania]
MTGPTVVTGVPSSPGRAYGPARVVRSVDDFGRMRPGDVLVCRTTDPAWTPLFRLAAAVVTETGGLLCHAAIVAREYRIPAVVGAADAMSRLDDGAPVTVDGALGTVTAAADAGR